MPRYRSGLAHHAFSAFAPINGPIDPDVELIIDYDTVLESALNALIFAAPFMMFVLYLYYNDKPFDYLLLHHADELIFFGKAAGLGVILRLLLRQYQVIPAGVTDIVAVTRFCGVSVQRPIVPADCRKLVYVCAWHVAQPQGDPHTFYEVRLRAATGADIRLSAVGRDFPVARHLAEAAAQRLRCPHFVPGEFATTVFRDGADSLRAERDDAPTRFSLDHTRWQPFKLLPVLFLLFALIPLEKWLVTYIAEPYAAGLLLYLITLLCLRLGDIHFVWGASLRRGV